MKHGTPRSQHACGYLYIRAEKQISCQKAPVKRMRKQRTKKNCPTKSSARSWGWLGLAAHFCPTSQLSAKVGQNMVNSRCSQSQGRCCQCEVWYLLQLPIAEQPSLPIPLLHMHVYAGHRTLTPIRRLLGELTLPSFSTGISGITLSLPCIRLKHHEGADA